MSSLIHRSTVRVGRSVRDAWLMVGIVGLMLLAFELVYLAQAAARGAFQSRGQGLTKSPYADSAWYPAYVQEYESIRMRWKPYVYFRRQPFVGRFVNVDSQGHRLTLPRPRPARDTVRVFFFGGSTMWGTDQRDAGTIASVTARRLAERAPPGVAFEVTNFGESGYIFTQELFELELQLRAGVVPDVVVFYDGLNDIGSAAQVGDAGVAQNETNRVREFEFGRAVFGGETGLAARWRASKAIAGAVAQQFSFIQRLMTAGARPVNLARPAEDVSREVARLYASTADIAETLSKAYRFRIVYVWQSTLHASAKKPTAYEQELLRRIADSPFHQRIRSLMTLAHPIVDTAMRNRVRERFVDQTTLFAGDTSSVYTDEIGHNTETSVQTIVDGFLPTLLAQAIEARASASRRLSRTAR